MRTHKIHASLFSGIGGPEVAAAMLGWHNAFHCEINPFGRKVLEYWFPKSVSYEDITKTDFTPWRGKIDVLTGGFPCQPFSYAGNRGGQKDARYLWPEMCRAIQEIRPTWVVGENVAGLATMVEGGLLTEVGEETPLFEPDNIIHGYELEQTFTIERICRDIEHLGYSVQPMLIPAAAVGAPHRRDRIFIIAYAPDSDRSDDVRRSGEDARKGKTERLQERDEVRLAGVADKLRPTLQGTAQNSEHVRCGIGEDGEQGHQRDFGNAGAGDSERICGKAGADFTYPYRRGSGEIQTPIHSRISDGNEPISNGRQRIASHSFCKGLERYDESGCCEGRERMCVRGNIAGYDWKADEGLLPENRWRCFPTVSPVHRGNDGIPFRMDNLTVPPIPAPPTYGKGNPQKYPFSKWRTETLKAYGNAIVPQVMYRIFQAIDKL